MTYKERTICLMIMWIILTTLSAGITVLFHYDKNFELGMSMYISYAILIGTTIGIFDFICKKN